MQSGVSAMGLNIGIDAGTWIDSERNGSWWCSYDTTRGADHSTRGRLRDVAPRIPATVVASQSEMEMKR